MNTTDVIRRAAAGRPGGIDAANAELAVLRALRLKGRATVAELAAATGLGVEVVAPIAGRLLDAEEAREVRDHLMLQAAARARLDTLLDQERARADRDAVNALYERFTAVNLAFKELANDWQTRDGHPNDHSDPAYDATVLARLPSVHCAVAPVLAGLTDQAARLRVYGDRLSAALARVQAGETEWLLRPLIDSYHTVWFEFHEELISLAGRTRLDEAAAGRAH